MKKHPSFFIFLMLAATAFVSSSVTESAEAKSQRGASVSQRLKVESGFQPATAGNSSVRRSSLARSRVSTVTVQPGDSLSKIAVEVLNVHSGPRLDEYVERLYRRNRALIGENPNLIYPGQVLRLPAPNGIVQSSISDSRAKHRQSSSNRVVRVERGDTVWSIATTALNRVLTQSEARRIAPYVRLVPRPTRRLLVSLAAEGAGARHPFEAVGDYVERIAAVNANANVIGHNAGDIVPGETIRLPKIDNATFVPSQGAGQARSESGVNLVDLVVRTADLPETKPTAFGLEAQGKAVTRVSSGPILRPRSEGASEWGIAPGGYLLLSLAVAFGLLYLFRLTWRENGRHSRRHRNHDWKPQTESGPRDLLVTSKQRESTHPQSSALTARGEETAHERAH